MPDISNQIAGFGRGAGSGVIRGINRAENRRRYDEQTGLQRNAFAAQQEERTLRRNEMLQQRDLQARQAMEVAEREHFSGGVQAILSAPEEQRPLMYQGVMQEAASRGFDVQGAPEYSDDVISKMAGAFGIDVRGSGQPSGVEEFRFLTEGMSPEDAAKAKRVKLGLDARAVGAAQKNVMIAGVPHVFDPQSGGYMPAAIQGQDITARDVATDKGIIAREEASAKAGGKSQGEALAELPQTLENSYNMTGLLDKVLEHPGFDEAVGFGSTLNPLAIAGTDRKDFLVLIDQLKGKAFLEAFESLKGGGHITEIEGQKATEAMARLNTSQSEKEFKEAILEMKGLVERGRLRAQIKAKGILQGQGAGTRSPARGAVEDGYEFVGGDPADPKSWKKQ